nr:hypothetical protein [Tanacetum cinerariifolium]
MFKGFIFRCFFGEKPRIVRHCVLPPEKFLVAFCSLSFVRKRTLCFGSCVLSLAIWLMRFDSCVLVLRFGPEFCLVEDLCCVLLRRDSAQIKTSLRFVSKLVQGIVHQCLQQDIIHNGDHVQVVASSNDSLAIPEHITVETPMNMSPKNKAHFEAEKEAIHLILTEIRDEIYSTVDACQTAQEMWEAIERLQQVNVQFLQQLQPEWSRFVTIVKQQHKLDKVSYHKLFDILKQYQKEVNELCAERLARNANPLALVATAQANQDPYYQTSKSYKSYAPSSKPIIPIRSHTTTRFKGKEIAKPITPLSETAFEEDNTTPRDKNDNQSEQFGNQRTMNECRKPKMVIDSVYHKEKMLMCKQAEKAQYSYMEKIQEVPTIDKCTDSEPLEKVQNDTGYNVFANDLQHSEQSESISNTCLVETDDSNVIPDSPDMREQYIKIQDLKAQLQDKNIAISELNKLIEKSKGKYMETKFDKPSVVRQPNAQRIPKPSVLGKPAHFSDSLERRYFSKTKSVPKTNVSKGLSKLVTTQTLPETTRQAVSNTNVPKLEMYRIDNRTTQTRAPQSHQTVRNTNPHVSTSTGVNHKTNVSRPQHRSNQLKDKVMPNNSQVKPKKTQVEEHPRISSISNKTKSVTTFDSNHFACVTKMLNDMNARTKKPNVVPISTRNPKGHANKSVATPHKKKVASKSTNQKPQSYFRMLYEKTRFIMSKASITISFKLVNFVMRIWRLLSRNLLVLLEIFRKDVMIGLPKLKYVKDQLCSSCELSRAKRSSFKSKAVPSLKGRLNLLHMDLCGPMRVARKWEEIYSSNCRRLLKIYLFFLRFKDETPEVLKEFLTMIQRNLQAPVITVRTDKGTEFLNKTLNAFFKEEEIKHQTFTARTPEQNGVVERRNRTLVEAAQTMLSASRLPLFFWAEAIANACYTQNRSIIIPTHDKTAYHIINDRKPSIKHLYVFWLDLLYNQRW